MSATRKSALSRNDVVAIIWIFQHHIFGSVKTYLAEPYSEVECKQWSKNWLNSFFDIQSVRESVSMFTLQSL